MKSLGVSFSPSLYFAEGKWAELIEKGPYERQVVYRSELDGVRYDVVENGFVILMTNDYERAIPVANSIFLAASLLIKRGFNGIGEYEIETLNYDESDLSATNRNGKLISPRGFISFYNEARKDIEGIYRNDEKPVYYVGVLGCIDGFASNILSSRNRNQLLRFYDAYTAKERGDWTSCFTLSWFCLEQALDFQIIRYLSSQSISKNFLDKFLDSRWTIHKTICYLLVEAKSKRLESLMKTKLLSESNLIEANRLRDVRNKTVHAGLNPSKQDALSCFNLANLAFLDYLVFDGIDLTFYQKEVQDTLDLRPNEDLILMRQMQSLFGSSTLNKNP